MQTDQSGSTPTRRIYLLGSLRVEQGNQPIRLPGNYGQSLLAYLALYPRTPHPREVLADLLWPETPPERVRRNFSDTLYRLRQALGQGWLWVEPDKVWLKPAPDLWVDVWEFNRFLNTGAPADLSQAIELYAGDLAPEIYDDWILTERVNLREQYLHALEQLVEFHRSQSNLLAALSYARRLIMAEPLREQNHQTYLALLGRLGHRNEALVHYQYLQKLLQQELGIDPMPETRAMVQAIQRELALSDPSPPLAEPTPFVGRIQERAVLLEAVEAAIAGQGQLIAIEGEAGIGKSRLLRAVAEGAHWRGAVVVSGKAAEQPAASPLGPLADALATALTGPRAALMESALSPQTVARLAPLPGPWRRLANLPELPPQQARQLFHQALGELLQALSNFKPHVLILDDLHWADPALWAALETLPPMLAQYRLLVLLAYRRPEIEQGAGWATLQQWERAGQLKTVSLKPLAEQDIAQMLPASLQSEVQSVLASTGGNPFFITELLLSAAAGKLPHGDTILTRVQTLPKAAQAALEAAAVIGAEVPYRLWAAVADLPPYLLAEASEQLEAKHLLQPIKTGYTFTHDLVHRAIYNRIAPANLRHLHRRAAGQLAQLEPDNLRSRAFHLDQGGEFAAAAVLYCQVGQQELAEFAFKEAEAAFDRALTLLPSTPTPTRLETLLALARVCDVTGNRVRQETALAEALELAGALADHRSTTEILLQLGRTAAQTGQIDAAATYLNQALELARQLDDASQQLETFFLLGDLAARQGKFAEARSHFETVLEQARQIEDRPRQANALRGLGIVARQTGQLEPAISWLEKALAVYQQLHDHLGASVTLANMLGCLYYLGAWDRVLTLADEALAMKEALGDRLGAAIVRQQQGLAAYALGDFDRADLLLEQVVQECEAVGERRVVGLTHNVLGLVAEARGELAEARRYYELALATAQAIGAETEAAYARHDLGALYVELDQPAQAVPLLAAAHATWTAQNNDLLRLKSEACLGLARLALGEQAGAEALANQGWSAFQQGMPQGELPQAWLWTLYSLLNRLQRQAEAQQVLRAAYDELQRQATAIANPDLRRSFYERVPLNRAILAAYDRLSQRTRQISVTLARQDAPLGRSLAAAELVAIRWTVDAPEDELIPGKSARRQYRLQRLLTEAAAQGAAPTDDQLAAALGVSRRTILRDMEMLAQAGFPLRTRRRSDRPFILSQ